jgi:PII-like signaling protein
MSKMISLRLYFHHSAKGRPTRFWHRISRPGMARHLLAQAKLAGIEQALLHRVQAGFIRGDRIHHEHVEHLHHRFPQCIELIDLEIKLRDFWQRHSGDLRDVHGVFLPCETAMHAAEEAIAI